jgi:hypothetical protein
MGPRASLDTEARGKILSPLPRFELDRLVVQAVARHYTDVATRLTNICPACFNNELCIFIWVSHVSQCK